jgi:general nucleoside transport system ATP-binding protein
MGDRIVETVGLRKRFGSTLALDGVDFACDKGEIHALLGENGAGKSTLVHLLAGLHRPDAGEIRLDGVSRHWRSVENARTAGVALVHQHFMLVPSLTVAENLALAQGRLGLVTPARLREEARSLASARRLELGDPDRLISDLAVGEQQRVEILKALLRPTRLLILDEPTAVLTPEEVESLFALLREIARQGSAIVIVTHKLREATSLADRVTVLHKGRVRGEGSVHEMDVARLTELMVPGGVAVSAPPSRLAADTSAGPMLLARDLRARDRRGTQVLDGVSLTVAGGRILAVAGVEGNGQAELVAALAGAFDGEISGEVRIADRVVTDAASARRAGLAVIPPDRQRDGLVAEMALWENLLLRVDLLSQAAPRGVLRRREVLARAQRDLVAADVRPPSPELMAGALSGGNQQRLVIARELGATRPPAVVAANPSRGLDVAASARVHRSLSEAAAGGAGVLLVSSDLDEVEAIADEVAVLYRGHLHGPFPAPVDRRLIGRLMASGEVNG